MGTGTAVPVGAITRRVVVIGVLVVIEVSSWVVGFAKLRCHIGSGRLGNSCLLFPLGLLGLLGLLALLSLLSLLSRCGPVEIRRIKSESQRQRPRACERRVDWVPAGSSAPAASTACVLAGFPARPLLARPPAGSAWRAPNMPEYVPERRGLGCGSGSELCWALCWC